MPPEPRPRILFLCTANSCRSQMAEGFARARLPHLDAHSAGIRSSHVDPLAVRAMAEVGLDISHHPSKTINDLRREGIDRFALIIAVCDGAAEACPVIPGSIILRAPFDDPPKLAAGAPSDDDAMPHYRRVRDEIRAFIASLPARVPELAAPTRRTAASRSFPASEGGVDKALHLDRGDRLRPPR